MAEEKCNRCGEPFEDEFDKYEHYDEVLCEDCYIGAIEPPRTCDVAAVHSAKTARKMAGQEGTEGLTDIQKDIFNYVKEQGKVTRPEIMKKFNMAEWELNKHFAVLRHCELLKGRKEGNKIYMVTFDTE